MLAERSQSDICFDKVLNNLKLLFTQVLSFTALVVFSCYLPPQARVLGES